MQARWSKHCRDEAVEWRAVALDGAFEFEALALAHDRHAVVADVATENDLVAGTGTIGRDADVVLDDTDAGCGDEDLVAFAAVDDLGVAGDELYAGLGGRGTHGFDYPPQIVHRKTFFEDERGREIQRAGSAHRQVVYCSVNGEPANVAAGKEDRCDNEGVGGECEPRSADGEHGLIVELIENGIVKGREEDLVDQVGGELAAATVSEDDLFVVEDRQRAGTEG